MRRVLVILYIIAIVFIDFGCTTDTKEDRLSKELLTLMENEEFDAALKVAVNLNSLYKHKYGEASFQYRVTYLTIARLHLRLEDTRKARVVAEELDVLNKKIGAVDVLSENTMKLLESLP